jgi:phthalate 4,5-dioxygenase
MSSEQRFAQFSAAENEILTRIGPGTPMGALIRRYWMPALRCDELPGPDCDQVRLRLLGEDLIAFRNTAGQTGILDQWCPHRRASLFFARCEGGGLRCAYHGWKFDVEGVCIDLPSEPDYGAWREPLRIKAYPTVERGGIIWVYMGPPAMRPAPPEFEYTLVAEANRYVSRRWQESNWLQGLEGGIDPVHVPYLHKFELQSDPLHRATLGADYTAATEMAFDCRDSAGGVQVIARRAAGADDSYWRIGQWIAPCFTIAPPYGDNTMGSNAWVPRDDESCWRWIMSCHPTRALTAAERDAMKGGQGTHVALDDRLRPLANKANDYAIDRAGQRADKTFSGVYSVGLQDQSVQENQGAGPIHRRQDEYLVASDRAIIRMRRRLLDAVRVVADGGAPPGLDADAQRVRAATLVTPRAHGFDDLGREILITRPGVPLTSI